MRRTMTTMKPASPTWGSRLILYGTFALILTSGFAAYMQIDVSRAFLDGIIKTNRKMGIPVFQYLFTMFNESEPVRKLAARLMFLLGLVILSFILIGQRKKTAACVIALPVCGLTYWAGCLLELYSLEPSDLIRFVVGMHPADRPRGEARQCAPPVSAARNSAQAGQVRAAGQADRAGEDAPVPRRPGRHPDAAQRDGPGSAGGPAAAASSRPAHGAAGARPHGHPSGSACPTARAAPLPVEDDQTERPSGRDQSGPMIVI